MKINMKANKRVIQVGDINIGRNIKKIRFEKGIRQNEMVSLLQLSGIDVSTYSYNRIENGTQNPTVSLLYECSRILGCDMNKLFLMSADN